MKTKIAFFTLNGFNISLLKNKKGEFEIFSEVDSFSMSTKRQTIEKAKKEFDMQVASIRLTSNRI